MEWQPIETAPKDGSKVFAATAPYVWVAFGGWRKWGVEEERWLADFGREGWLPTIQGPTHWLAPPTPDAPKQE